MMQLASLSADKHKEQLVTANRILGRENILDALGHVSVRDDNNSGKWLLSKSRAPEYVELSDILEFSPDGSPVAEGADPLYSERFIHAAIYESRSDVSAICHSHMLAILPFSISSDHVFRAAIHTGRFIGQATPVWDVATEFGDATDLLVTDLQKGRSLANSLGENSIVLMRGHGCTIVADNLVDLVKRCIAAERNARVQLMAANLGSYRCLSEGECGASVRGTRETQGGTDRSWEYFTARAGR